MSIRCIIFGTAVLLLTEPVKVLAESEPSKEVNVIISLLSDHSFDDIIAQIRSMSPDERANVVRAVRENKSGQLREAGPGSDIGSDVLAMLGLLGDPEERKKSIARFRGIPFNYPELVRLGEPWVIQEVAQDMFREEEWMTVPDGDIGDPPLSYGAASLIMENLQHSTIYREEVLQWAKRTNADALPELRGVMRDWWRENERFFKEKNYQAVKPGRTLALPSPVSPEPQPKSPSVQPATPSLSLPPAPLSQPTLNYRWKPAAIIAALLTLLGVGLWWFRQQKK